MSAFCHNWNINIVQYSYRVPYEYTCTQIAQDNFVKKTYFLFGTARI